MIAALLARLSATSTWLPSGETASFWGQEVDVAVSPCRGGGKACTAGAFG